MPVAAGRPFPRQERLIARTATVRQRQHRGDEAPWETACWAGRGIAGRQLEHGHDDVRQRSRAGIPAQAPSPSLYMEISQINCGSEARRPKPP